VARIAAPVVFLAAIIAVVALVYESGIVGGADTSPTASPTPTATKSGGQTTKVVFKKYTVKDGDTLSAIADKYGTTVNAILALNPDMSTSTLVVGTRIKVPKPSPSP
jgi:LysM repeat protein